MPGRSAPDILRMRRSGARPPVLSVGLMAANLADLATDLRTLDVAGVEAVHVDVMDGRFSGPITVGPAVVAAIGTALLKDVHLLVADPAASVDAFLEAGGDIITFHLEAASQPRALLRRIGEGPRHLERRSSVVRGVAINPSTPIEFLEPLLDDLDYVLLLAIDPGWPGQGFAPSTARRLERVRRLADDAGTNIAVGIDGGITSANFATVVDLGADVIVSGSAIFDGRDAAANARTFLSQLARSVPGPASA